MDGRVGGAVLAEDVIVVSPRIHPGGGGAGRLGYGVLAEDVIMVSPLILLGDRVGCYCCYPPDSSGGG